MTKEIKKKTEKKTQKKQPICSDCDIHINPDMSPNRSPITKKIICAACVTQYGYDTKKRKFVKLPKLFGEATRVWDADGEYIGEFNSQTRRFLKV